MSRGVLNIFSDNEIIRYIYGWRGDTENAKKSMEQLKLWRESYKPELIHLNEFTYSGFDYSSLLNINCQDIYGRPILLLKAKLLIPDKIEINLFVRYLIYIIGQGIKKMPANIDKFILVIDMKDAGYSNLALDHIKKIKEVTSKFFVERLANIVLINKGFFFGMLWKLVSAFLDERVLQKLVVYENKYEPWFKKILGENYKRIM